MCSKTKFFVSIHTVARLVKLAELILLTGTILIGEGKRLSCGRRRQSLPARKSKKRASFLHHLYQRFSNFFRCDAVEKTCKTLRHTKCPKVFSPPYCKINGTQYLINCRCALKFCFWSVFFNCKITLFQGCNPSFLF